MPKLHPQKGIGDLYVEILPLIPHDLTGEEKNLFVRLKELRASKEHG